MSSSNESLVEFTTPEGEELVGHLVRLGRFDAVFDVFGRAEGLRTSEALPVCKIVINGRVVYEGRATVGRLIDEAESVRCEVLLDERGVHADALPSGSGEEFERFLAGWLVPYQLASAFKVAVADFEILMMQLRRWLNQVDVKLRSSDPDTLQSRMQDVIPRIAPKVIASIKSQHERFEELFSALPFEQQVVHRNYAATKLGPYFLCTPFGHRTYHKPLGYAGDFEMMNMIHRNRPEGDSLYSRLMHLLLVRQWPAESVRNRVTHLQDNIVNETARVARAGRRAKIMNLGCGPAWEIQKFIQEHTLSDQARFRISDFNEKTIHYTGDRLRELARTSGRRVEIDGQVASVQQVLRNALQSKREPADRFDLIYCAGLFDYLSETTCKALIKFFCDSLEPNGLVIVANMNDSKPFRHFIESILEWHLIYRDSTRMRSWRPANMKGDSTVITEPTSVNLFLHLRPST
jgi:extracellular factor (EF) 3-hydroxypalmitic acid methyl ester biosynthesis protein